MQRSTYQYVINISESVFKSTFTKAGRIDADLNYEGVIFQHFQDQLETPASNPLQSKMSKTSAPHFRSLTDMREHCHSL